MINWVENFHYYKKFLYFPHCSNVTKQFCDWYQENCRYYEPESFNGWLDEIRISKEFARWTSNFIVPLVRVMLCQYQKIRNDESLIKWYQDTCRYYEDE